jgi:hypothetical protein
MSWLFSQALVAEFSAGTCSAGAPFAPLSGSPTPQAFLSPDRMTAFSRLSRFGMTFKPLTDDLGAGVLTWCLAASLVRTFPQQERERESTEHEAECGDTWHESFARWDRDSCSWRTPQCSLLEGLDVFSETWPRWGMMRAGECSEQSMPVRTTNEKESGLWRSPCARDWKGTTANTTYDQGRAQYIQLTEGGSVSGTIYPNPITYEAVADGVAARVDRLKAIGNGQVPAVAATAWKILTQNT